MGSSISCLTELDDVRRMTTLRLRTFSRKRGKVMVYEVKVVGALREDRTRYRVLCDDEKNAVETAKKMFFNESLEEVVEVQFIVQPD